MAWIWLIACAATGGEKPDSSCEEQPLVELPGEIPDGWTPAAGCTTVCEGTDGGGLSYIGCYLTTEGAVTCQFRSDCS